MIKEAYVNYETAKLLRKKGFDEPCRSYFIDNGDYIDSSYSTEELTDLNIGVWETLRPTLQMACAWLREVHNMHIDIDPSEGNWWPCVIELETWSSISDGNLKICDTYEEAVEEALKYTLENLI